MNKEWLLKLAEAYKKVEDFERAYLSPKSVFSLMKTAGVISEEEKVELNVRYDLTMEPVNKKIDEVKGIVYTQAKAIVLPFFRKRDE